MPLSILNMVYENRQRIIRHAWWCKYFIRLYSTYTLHGCTDTRTFTCPRFHWSLESSCIRMSRGEKHEFKGQEFLHWKMHQFTFPKKVKWQDHTQILNKGIKTATIGYKNVDSVPWSFKEMRLEPCWGRAGVRFCTKIPQTLWADFIAYSNPTQPIFPNSECDSSLKPKTTPLKNLTNLMRMTKISITLQQRKKKWWWLLKIDGLFANEWCSMVKK